MGPGVVDVVTHDITAHGTPAHRNLAELHRKLGPLQGTAGEGTLGVVVATWDTPLPVVHIPAARNLVPRLVAELVSAAQHFGIQPVADNTG
eukprot:9918298-Prorocentrum_lima.AAC.1